MNYQAILFDLDGTLVDSIHDIAAAANAMLVSLGYPQLLHEQICSFVGRGVDALVWQCLLVSVDESAPSPELYQQGRQAFAQHYQQQLEAGQTPIFDGVIAGLDRFRQAGCQLAVVTNKPLAYTKLILQQTQLAEYFSLVVGGDSCEEKKPHPLPLLYACAQLEIEPAHSLMIGDSVNDSQAAQEADIDVLLVPYGYSPNHDVHSLGAQAVVADLVQAYEWASKG